MKIFIRCVYPWHKKKFLWFRKCPQCVSLTNFIPRLAKELKKLEDEEK
jgi:hypothetical protein